MNQQKNSINKFWQELKRRNVVRVITVYAGAAFVIIELISNITEPLRLPEWTPTLVIVLLAVGFPIAIIFSWIYDIHPGGGMVKTEPAEKVKGGDVPKSSSGWKIASYISFVLIVGLIVLNILGRKGPGKIDESLAKSIAVLPFYNYSGDLGQDYMCEGLTQEIISHLFKVRTFDEVKGLTSVLPFKDSSMRPPEIAQALKVNYILEGTYSRMGEMLKVTVNLIDANSGNAIWVHDYELPYNEVMGIPGEIALQIAYNLKAFMTEGEQESIDRISTDNLEVYEIGKQIALLYNRAVTELNSSYYGKIIELANNAIAMDPEYADAYAFLGNLKLFEGNYSGDKEMLSVMWDAERYFKKAIELDPYNLIANAGLALIRLWVYWDYVAMEDFGSKYPKFSSSESIFVTGYTMFKTQMGKFEEAVSIPERDYFDDNVIKAHILLGNEERVRDLLKREVMDQSYYPRAGELYIWLQEFDTALYYLESALSIELKTINFPRYQADLALAFYKSNKIERAQNIIGRLKEKSDTTKAGSPAYFTGWYYSWTRDLDSAFYWLDKAVENRSAEIPWLKVDPAFNSLKDDQRYWDLYERTGHKAYDDYMVSKNQ